MKLGRFWGGSKKLIDKGLQPLDPFLESQRRLLGLHTPRTSAAARAIDGAADASGQEEPLDLGVTIPAALVAHRFAPNALIAPA